MQLKELIPILQEHNVVLGCSDTSCPYSSDKGGLKTNGGCRCLKYVPFRVREAVGRFPRSDIEKLKEILK